MGLEYPKMKNQRQKKAHLLAVDDPGRILFKESKAKLKRPSGNTVPRGDGDQRRHPIEGGKFGLMDPDGEGRALQRVGLLGSPALHAAALPRARIFRTVSGAHLPLRFVGEPRSVSIETIFASEQPWQRSSKIQRTVAASSATGAT